MASVLCPGCETRYRVSIKEMNLKKCPGCGKTFIEVGDEAVKRMGEDCELNSDRITLEDFLKLARQ